MSQAQERKTLKIKSDTHKTLELFKRFANGLPNSPLRAGSYDGVIIWALQNSPLTPEFKAWCKELDNVQEQK